MGVDLKERGISVFDLTIDEPVREQVGIDVESLFADEDWENIDSRWREFSRSNSLPEFMRDLKLVSETKFNHYLNMKDPFTHIVTGSDHLAALEMIIPGSTKKVDNLTWKSIHSEVPRISIVNLTNLRDIWKVIGLYPEKLKDYDLDTIANEVSAILRSKVIVNSALMVKVAAMERLILGDEKARLYKTADINPLIEYLYHLRYLTRLKNTYTVYELMEYARNLKIVTASRVAVTEKGLEIVPHKVATIDQDPIVIPAVRSF